MMEKFLQTCSAEKRQGNFDAKICLKRRDIPRVEEALQVGRGRVRRIQLCKRRCQQEYSSAQFG